MHPFLASACTRARKEVLIGSILLAASMAAFALFFIQNYLNSQGVLSRFIPGTGLERVVYNLIFAVFMYGSFAYQVSRLSFFWHLQRRTRDAQVSYKRFSARPKGASPRVEILVPSYNEETHVVWQTLMSAALLDYPDRGVVLLLDNAPFPNDPAQRELLLSTRAQVEAISALFAPIERRFAAASEKFCSAAPNSVMLEAAAREAAGLYHEAADFLEALAAQTSAGAFGGTDGHGRSFFIERILLEPAKAHRRQAQQLRGASQSFATLHGAFYQLAQMFRVRLTCFERKKYVNLTHAPTKAANLNAYISIMGLRLKTSGDSKGAKLVKFERSDEEGGGEVLETADAEYIIILDADSLVLSDYAKCMVAALESPQNARAAVMQTPYTAIPGCPHVLERLAGANTDIYYYVTSGMGFAKAGFWVGASATIRKRALLEIAIQQEERGYPVPIYIQDKTVIEDTGATIDLLRHGWSVQNYPARLSYSATPSDFGALVVQRRRWANGGLIIVPSLIKHIFNAPMNGAGVLEALLRLHYLIMPACISFSMLLMLIYPFDFKRVSSWIYFTLPPYLFLICRDLVHTGYRRRDIFGAYALFLLLLPVVLTGVRNSLYQMIFGIKAQFGRTPKIDHRTGIPITCIAIILGLLAWSIMISYDDLNRGNRLHAVFALLNAVALGYGVFAMIGVKAIVEDCANAVTASAVSLQVCIRAAFADRTDSKLPVHISPTPAQLMSDMKPAVLPSAARRRLARSDLGRRFTSQLPIAELSRPGHSSDRERVSRTTQQ